MSQTAELIRLSDLPPDIPARLTEIQGGRQLTRRLLALGLRQGSPVQVIQRRGRGLVVASGELRIAVGIGIADKLWVSMEAEPGETEPVASTIEPSQPAGADQLAGLDR
ncbi:ferrous iron transport protein A [Caldichromatium japonicum]|uniref:Ferrous iron transport protein A n=1 Tax=Caldichromatium japonicum TaxID=2699430 RepID=A0A6G7VG62_9GAMM|nr:ferrous iron transport protein A [Caldichromatium japonicum]QIK39011.1 ferrous iron transport protein A [Caldichromatium japonicum]